MEIRQLTGPCGMSNYERELTRLATTVKLKLNLERNIHGGLK
jgi:hypothetical protein